VFRWSSPFENGDKCNPRLRSLDDYRSSDGLPLRHINFLLFFNLYSHVFGCAHLPRELVESRFLTLRLAFSLFFVAESERYLSVQENGTIAFFSSLCLYKPPPHSKLLYIRRRFFRRFKLVYPGRPPIGADA